MPQAQYQSPQVAVNGPSISGRDLTVDMLLKNPTIIQTRVANFAQLRLISGYIFRQISAPSGSVIFNRVDSNQVRLVTGPRVKAEGAEMALVEGAEPAPQVIMTRELAGKFYITDQARRRNASDTLEQMQQKMENEFVLNQDGLCMGALAADPVVAAAVGADGKQGGTQAAVGAWSDNTNGNPIKDIATAVANISNRRLGYRVTTALIHPLDAVNLLVRPDTRQALPRETNQNPILSGQLTGFMGLEWIMSEFVPQGTVYFLEKNIIGAVAEEAPYLVETDRDKDRQVTWLYTSRSTGVFIDNPYAIIRLTGV